MGKRKVEVFWEKRGGNSLKYWHRARNPLRVIANFLVIWLAKYCPSLAVKRGLYRLVGMKVGRDVSVGLGATFDIFFPELIEIGDNSIIGFDALVLAHEFLVERARKGKVRIGKGVLIGARVLILPGVKIGDGAKVASYSLVNRDVKPGEFVGGIPIRSL
ncbi:MAG: acyltransferase, partial [Candidatus Aenigmatarchaeota archaeon]